MLAPSDCNSSYDASISSANTPVNGRFERQLPLAKKYGDVTARHGSYLLVRVKPADLKAKCVPVMLLSTLNVSHRQLRHGWG
jgi:hypothetical protein